MNWPFKDYDYYGEKYVNIGDIMWYERENVHSGKLPTECEICIEAEKEIFTEYAHPKAHLEAHTQATHTAKTLATKEPTTDDFIDYYIFHYGREYTKIYKELYTKYKEEYNAMVLERTYDMAKICPHHQECIQYHNAKKSAVDF